MSLTLLRSRFSKTLLLPGMGMLFFLLSASVSANNRVALVVGNDSYPADGNFPNLANCVRDSNLIKNTLESLGFQVIHAMNASRSEMDEKLTEFENAISRGGAAVFYFAGHGIEFNGKNYLMGSNAKLQARSRLGEEAMDAETFAEAMLLAGAKSSFLFLDCCREVPGDTNWLTRGTKKRGLAEIHVDGDIIIAYAAKPGQAALDGQDGNSPYAKALSKWLPSGMKHGELFDQVRLEVHQSTGGSQRTWESGSFLEPFFFNPNPAPALTTALPPAPLPAPQPAAVNPVSLPQPDPSSFQPAGASPSMASFGASPSRAGTADDALAKFHQQIKKVLEDHPPAEDSLAAHQRRLLSLVNSLDHVPVDGIPEDLRSAFGDFFSAVKLEYSILAEIPSDFPWGDTARIELWAKETAQTNPGLISRIGMVPQVEQTIQEKGNLVDAIMAKYGIFIPNAHTEPAMRGESETALTRDEALARFRNQITNIVKNNPQPQEGSTQTAMMTYFRRLAGDVAVVSIEGLPQDLAQAYEEFRKPILTIASILAELPADLNWDDEKATYDLGFSLSQSNPALAARVVSIGPLAMDMEKTGSIVDAIMAKYGIVPE